MNLKKGVFSYDQKNQDNGNKPYGYFVDVGVAC
jgi:hypothetical protein